MLPSRTIGASLALLLLVSAAPLSGCGGGGSADGDAFILPMGRVRISVRWPEASRLIPTHARSIRIEVRNGATVLGQTLIAHPNTQGTVGEVPVGTHTVHAIAYASNNGTGTPIALAVQPASVTDGATSSVALTLATTVDHLEYAPNPFVIGAGRTLGLVVTARDADGDAVMLDPNSLTYSDGGSPLLAIAADGTVTAGAGVGTATLSVSDANSGLTLNIPTQIKVGVVLAPATATLNVNAATSFAATIIGDANTAVTWSVREANAGTVSSAGVYTAPNRRGIYHVVATSVADPTRHAEATVTVTSGAIDAQVD